jgi:general secretion pathway protein G
MRGFTLVELGLTLAVVAVLAAIAVPSYTGWKSKALVKKATEDILALQVVIDQHFADTGAWPADLAAIGRNGLSDPWGNPYQYLALNTPRSRGHARKDHSLVPLNSDYDLYSMGPDGDSVPPLTGRKSRDDILRANNGRFVGPASSY